MIVERRAARERNTCGVTLAVGLGHHGAMMTTIRFTVPSRTTMGALFLSFFLCHCSGPGPEGGDAGGAGPSRSGSGGGGGSATVGTSSGGGAPGATSSSSSSASTGLSGSGTGGMGGSGTGGMGGTPVFEPSFILGADISSVQEAVDNGARYTDTDGNEKGMLDLLKNHGFNYIRLRTFVDPGANYGYAFGTGGSCEKREDYCDKDHTIEFGKQIKAAGMGFLLDFHYSDTWADPGKQIIPEAWRNAQSIAEMAGLLKAYTKDVVAALVSEGARPDMVQIGNEITPGMLIHVPSASTDCWGNNSVVNPRGLTGRATNQNWDNLAALLKAGIEGVKEVDDTIKIMLHVENTEDVNGVTWWVNSAKSRGVEFDVLGLSCYTAFQGEPEVWEGTFNTLAETFPDLSFAIAEYNPERTRANQIMRDLPDGRGLGTFFWEPTQSGSWGSSLFTQQGGAYRANRDAFAEFDAIKASFGL
ncbi:glycosyl hydrolase 53 family protein [Sorangium sp. So ce513]|uniref:glycosyl hydrolase 53 family protein n=2 Tax=unclassified Sorangium TaxID=2621164 RepID=UPI003F60259D